MRKSIKIVLAICGCIAFFKIFGWIQNDHVSCPIVEVTENTVTFDRNGNEYVWECSDTSRFCVGDVWKVDMFDCENYDATDDIIVKVVSKLN